MAERTWITDEQLAELRAKHGPLYFIEPEKFAGMGVVFRRPTKIEATDLGGATKPGTSAKEIRPPSFDLALKVVVWPGRDALYAHLQDYDIEERIGFACIELRQGVDLTLAKKL